MKTMMNIEEAKRHAELGTKEYNALYDRARQAMPDYIWYWGKGKRKRGYCSACHNDFNLVQEPGWVNQEQTPCGFVTRDNGRTEKGTAWTSEAQDMRGWEYVETEDAGFDRNHPGRELGLISGHFSTAWNGHDAYDLSGQHGHFGLCPLCGRLIQYRSLGRGRKSVQDRVFLIQYHKSAIDPDALVMTGWLCMMDWGGWDDYNEAEPDVDITRREICVFRPGQGGERFVTQTLWTAESRQDADGNILCYRPRAFGLEWLRRKKCVSGFDPFAAFMGNGGTRFVLDEDSLISAVKGGSWETPVREIMRLGGYDQLDMIDMVNAIAKYPSIEYLCKLGLAKLLIWQKEYPSEGRKEMLNLRGKTAQRVLRVDGNDWGWIKGNREETGLDFLRLLWRARKIGARVSPDLLSQALKRNIRYSVCRMLENTAPERAGQALKWCLKNGVSANEYADYLEQLKKLGMDMNDKSILYPKEFEQAHGRLNKRIGKISNLLHDRMIEMRLDKLGQYYFSALGLTLRPMASSGEIIREGETLHHCVAGYIERYANGGTVLLCLREDEHPDRPWRTVEFTGAGQMVQCRGMRNKSPEEEQPRIDQFWKLFDFWRKEYERFHRSKHQSGFATRKTA